MKKKAFTLAECLITLGIIGIVAAMTLPSLIQKHQERVAVTKVKKFYSIMSQALQFAIAGNGAVDEWVYGQTGVSDSIEGNISFVNYFKKYLKISKDCGSAPGCLADVDYTLLNGTLWGDYDNDPHYKMILVDGSYLWIRGNYTNCTHPDGLTPNVCGILWIDVNGKKSPNQIGRDTFAFFIMKNAIIPHSAKDCENPLGGGWGCAAHILQHGDMGYLHN